MIKIQTGQVCWIGDTEVYDKKNGKKKTRFALTQANIMVEGRLETIEYDLLDDNINLLADLRIGIGDYIEVSYQDLGRVYHYTDESRNSKPKFYQNKHVIDIKVIG